MSLFRRRLPQQRQVILNDGTTALEVMVEITPHESASNMYSDLV